eukprot:GHVP01052164.1.p1 GENE.GHVP01052164.1~~GHVP01052164.1.p1  ORF type:complete len:138 (+),score=12.28 GHVP01052164.1:813-1226(+)
MQLTLSFFVSRQKSHYIHPSLITLGFDIEKAEFVFLNFVWNSTPCLKLALVRFWLNFSIADVAESIFGVICYHCRAEFCLSNLACKCAIFHSCVIFLLNFFPLDNLMSKNVNLASKIMNLMFLDKLTKVFSEEFLFN